MKAVALGWREEDRENARKISDLGKELHERIAVSLAHVERLGRSLESSVKSYNQFVGSFETRVVTSSTEQELGDRLIKELPADPTPRSRSCPAKSSRPSPGDDAGKASNHRDTEAQRIQKNRC
ncbi:MAG: DNA recombination protein RmuC [Phycisphaerales bacterium]